jgi:hypothetical protein
MQERLPDNMLLFFVKGILLRRILKVDKAEGCRTNCIEATSEGFSPLSYTFGAGGTALI